MSTAVIDRYTEARERVYALKGQADLLDQQIAGANERALEAERDAEYHAQALQILQLLEERWRGNFAAAVGSIVSQGLATVFGGDMTVNIDTAMQRGVASTKLSLTTAGLRTPILGAKGGSVVNVLSFLWHTVLTRSTKPALAPVLLLDEPFSHVSTEYRAVLCHLLRELCGRLGIQVLMTSHEEEMMEAADRVYLVENEKGIANYRLIKSADEERE